MSAATLQPDSYDADLETAAVLTVDGARVGSLAYQPDRMGAEPMFLVHDADGEQAYFGPSLIEALEAAAELSGGDLW